MNSRDRVIGFIGRGPMGSRIAERLIGAGFEVVAFNRTREKAQATLAEGAVWRPILGHYGSSHPEL
jgi:3-hydroxyisobutyrate dehydrogenase-like beta-hydroxyacid dehydrogenase